VFQNSCFCLGALIWCSQVEVDGNSCVHVQELKKVWALMTQKYYAKIEAMQVDLSAITNQLNESATTLSHQQSTIDGLEQHLVALTRSYLDVKKTIGISPCLK
jgi:predicted nucleic acid-binding Zn finger protein